MKAVAFLAAAALLAGAAHAETPASTYTLEVWAAPSGFAVARTVGPLSAGDCALALVAVRKVDAPIPPNMQRLISQCVPKYTMVAQISGWNCAAAGSKPVARHPDAKLWLYSCFAK